MYEIIFYVLCIVGIVAWGAHKVKQEEIILHDEHADDFNKDFWED